MSALRERVLRYLKTNWGAPFVLAFIVLLIASAALLSSGQSDTANSVAVYAFYALVLGVVLQIASYIKFGESETQESTPYIPSSVSPPRSFRPGKKTLAVLLIIIVLVAGIGSVVYYLQNNSQNSHTTTTSTTRATSRTIGPLSLSVGFIKELPEAQNNVQIILGVNQTGGVQPFNFSAYWSDRVNQSNSVGVFIRGFSSNQSIPASVEIFVKSSDGQSATVSAQIPPVNRTTTTTSTVNAIPIITFIESGLPSGALWTLTLSGTEFHSNSTQIIFNYPSGGVISYAISGPYDSKSFAWAFIPTPQSGSITVNKSDTQIRVTFTNKSVTTPPNQLFMMTGPPKATSSGTGSEQLSFTYLNTFPDQVQGIVFATVKNSGTGAISVQTATISPLASSLQTVNLIFNGLKSGNYSAGIFVESPSGVLLSQTTNSTFAFAG